MRQEIFFGRLRSEKPHSSWTMFYGLLGDIVLGYVLFLEISFALPYPFLS